MKNTPAPWKRKIARDELKTIESRLHPCPVINGCDILHEHKGRKIVFAAWKGNSPANRRTLDIDRLTVLNDQEFYAHFAEELKWLTEEAE
jgi:hypothetical protein